MTRLRALAGRVTWQQAAVFLFVLSFALSGAGLLWTAHVSAADDRKFCGVVTGVTSVRVPQPANPKANPSRETSWQWYERFVRLSRDLGC